MGQLVDQLKVWSAMRGQERGNVAYDRLAEAGTPGRVVLDNMFGLMLDNATHSVDAATREMAAERGVRLDKGGGTTYERGGHLMVSGAVVLSVSSPESDDEGVTGVAMHYGLSNEPQSSWEARQAGHRQGRLFGNVSGPFSEIERALIVDYKDALADPARFIEAAAGRFADTEGLEKLSFLGHDAVMQLTEATRTRAEIPA